MSSDAPDEGDDHALDEDLDEERHWNDVARTFLFYEELVSSDLLRRQQHLNRLSDRHAALLPESTFTKISALAHAARGNQDFFDDLVMHYAEHMQKPDGDGKRHFPSKRGDAVHFSRQHRNQAVLHSMHREWSVDGKEERDAAFGPLLAELQRLLPVTTERAYRQRVLIPGCGTGRLPLEVAALGYSAEGNEFSAYMLMCGNFVLNGIQQRDEYRIYPWLDRVCNVVGVADPLQAYSVPDVSAVEALTDSPYFHLFEDFLRDEDEAHASGQPKEVGCLPCREPAAVWDMLPRLPQLGMSSGDFVDLYGKFQESSAGRYDAVVTCFFLDTAPVVMDYVECIHHCLRPGGVWINLGPLLYHWVTDEEGNGDARYQQSIELSYEEVKHVIEQVGFVVEKEERVRCTYTRCKASMMHTTYDAALFVARRPLK